MTRLYNVLTSLFNKPKTTPTNATMGSTLLKIPQRSLSCHSLIDHHATKTHGTLGIHRQAFLISALYQCERSPSSLGRYRSGKRAPVCPLKGTSMDPSASIDATVEDKSSLHSIPCSNSYYSKTCLKRNAIVSAFFFSVFTVFRFTKSCVLIKQSTKI